MVRKVTAAATQQSGVYVYAMDDAPWRDLPRKGAKEKAVRRDPATGHYLGVVAFEPLTRSGLHQHLGTALSYFLSGSLSDYQGSASVGMAGINLAGATHDAISHGGCLLASRLEGPVIVPDDASPAHPIHGAAKGGAIRNPHPERWPDINIPVEPIPLAPTAFPGVGRRLVFDYAATDTDRRMACLTFLPHSAAVEVTHEGLTDLYVLAGDLAVNGKRALANSFVIFEPGARAVFSSEYGCMALAWAEGPGRGERGELYGF